MCSAVASCTAPNKLPLSSRNGSFDKGTSSAENILLPVSTSLSEVKALTSGIVMPVKGNRSQASSQLQVTICSLLHPKKSTGIMNMPLAHRKEEGKTVLVERRFLADLCRLYLTVPRLPRQMPPLIIRSSQLDSATEFTFVPATNSVVLPATRSTTMYLARRAHYLSGVLFLIESRGNNTSIIVINFGIWRESEEIFLVTLPTPATGPEPFRVPVIRGPQV